MHRYWASGLDIYALSQPVVTHEDHGYSFLDETRLAHSRQARAAYPDAGRLEWRLWRLWSKLADSVVKRTVFPSYVRRGKRDDWELHPCGVSRLTVKLYDMLSASNPLRPLKS